MSETRSFRRRFAAHARPRLVLGGLAAAAGLSLGGCDSAPDFKDAQFTTISECTKAGFDAAECEAGYNTAALEYQKSAPRFNSLASCEQEWGGNHCMPYVSPNTGMSVGNIFVPMMAGFVVSQALQRRYYEGGNIGYYGGYGGFSGSPIYRDRTGRTVTVDRSGGAARMSPVNVNTSSVSRSGFGGMGMSRSSGSRGFGG